MKELDKESGNEKGVTSLSKSSDRSFITGMLNKSAKVIVCLTILNMLVFYNAFTHFLVWNVYKSGYISYSCCNCSNILFTRATLNPLQTFLFLLFESHFFIFQRKKIFSLLMFSLLPVIPES